MFVPKAALTLGRGLMGHAVFSYTEGLTHCQQQGFLPGGRRGSDLCIRFPPVQGLEIRSRFR